MPDRRSFTPAQLTGAYVAASAAWIVGTDLLVTLWVGTKPIAPFIEIAKGLGFVVLTAAFLHHWARRVYVRPNSEAEALAHARERTEHARIMHETLSLMNRRVLRLSDRPAVCRALCDALLSPAGFCGATILETTDTFDTVVPVAHAQAAPRTGSLAVLTGSDHARDRLRQGQPVIGRAAPEVQPCLDALRAAPVAQACAFVPFRPAGGAPHVLAVYHPDQDFFCAEIVTMLQALAADIAYSLETVAERERRAAAEAALRDSEERYRLVTDHSQDVIWMLSVDGMVQYISPSIERLLGYTPDEMMKMHLSAYLTPESYALAVRTLQEAADDLERTGQIRSRILELEQRRADGTTVWTEVNTTNFRDELRQRTSILGVTRDLTQRRAARQALASEVARCRALLDVSVDGVHVTDLDARLIEANEVFLRERGFTRAQIPTLRVHDWQAEYSPAEILRRHRQFPLEPIQFETVHRRGDGSVFPVEVRAKRVSVNGQDVVYCTTRDITERKALEQRLLRAQRLESVGLIASGIAHDLNNVLTPIMLSSGLLAMRYTTPDDDALLKPIEAAARRGSNIVQQILTFARGAEGQRIVVEPRVLLKELCDLIRETFPRNITHALTIAPDARSVIGDPTQLHQVFLNLAVNARDAMPDGGTLAISVANRSVGERDAALIPARPGDYVCISVKDTGTGMTPEVLNHVFEPFFTTKPRGRGTGLGLSTVHGLVRSHGGFVEVNSAPGRGSEFRVCLPVSSGERDVAPVIHAPGAAPLVGRGDRVLIVDDEPAILNVLASVLRKHGFNPVTAGDGEEALGIIEAHGAAISVLVTDVMMPRLDGIRLSTEVRRRHPGMPIVAMSGMISASADDLSRSQLAAIGVTRILDKPYAEPDLMSALAQALQRDDEFPMI